MELGWIRTKSDLSRRETCAIIAHADDTGLRHVHLPTITLGTLAGLPKSGRVSVSVQASTLSPQSPRAVAEALRTACRVMDGRLVLTLSSGGSPATWAFNQMLEALLVHNADPLVKPDLSIEPRPGVLVLPDRGDAPDMRRAAGNGFHVMSPVWSAPSSVTRHWREIVLGATHALRRASLSQWHVARCVFVSEDRAKLDAYRTRIANAFPHHQISDVMITGPAAKVAYEIAKLRQRAGRFGVLQVIDPGFDLFEGRQQCERLVRDVVPIVRADEFVKKQEMERI